MIEAFREEDDIHRRTAAQVFHHAAEEMVTPLMRCRAKAVNFRHCIRHRSRFLWQGTSAFP